MSACDDEYEKEFKRKNNFHIDAKARICFNCAHYWEYDEDRGCSASRHDVGKNYFRDMWVDPNGTCNSFEASEEGQE